MSEKVFLFVDGSYKGVINKDSTGWAFVAVTQKDGEWVELYHENGVLNALGSRQIRGELRGVIVGVDWAIKNGYKVEDITICYDYEGIMQWYETSQGRRGWSTMKEVGREYVSQMAKYSGLTFKYVKGHGGNRWNNLADKLACDALTNAFGKESSDIPT